MNIAELCLSPDLGGLELHVAHISTFLSLKHKVLALLNTHSKLEPLFKEKNIAYTKFSRDSLFTKIATAKKIATLIDKEAIDIIHVHWTKDLVIAVLAKKLASKKVKIVQSRHMRMTLKKDDIFHRYIYRNIDLMFAVTKQVAQELEDLIPLHVRPKIEQIYLGVNEVKGYSSEQIQAFRNEHKMQGFCVGIIGRIEPRKGQYLVMEAVNTLENVSAYIVGHAMNDEYLEQLQEKASAKVHFLGFMKEPNLFYQACDVIILATDCETFGLVLIEAMKNEIAVIGANNCGALEIIEDGKNGLLFENANASSLAQTIEKLYLDKALHVELVNQAKKDVDTKFALDKQFGLYEQALEKLITP